MYEEVCVNTCPCSLGDHHIAVRSSGVKEFHHRDVGDLTLDSDMLIAASDTDQ